MNPWRSVTRKWLLYTGGVMALGFAALHLMFPKLFNWPQELSQMTQINQGLMKMLNASTVYTLLFSVIITFFLARTNREFVFFEKLIIVFVAGIYLTRVLFGARFFGYSSQELLVWIICLVTMLCYLLSMMNRLAPNNGVMKE